jgi:hypothetical protein
MLTALPAGVALASWSLTAPVELRPNVGRASVPAPLPSSSVESVSVRAAPDRLALAWPTEPLAGEPAKQLLLEILLAAEARLKQVPGYTARFRKQERLRGRLQPEQTLVLKLRHEPFSIYMKFLAPKEGKELIYVAGFNDDCLIGHNGDWTRRLIPRLKVRPTDPIALLESRHPVTEAGLANLTAKLIGYRRLDLADPDAETILDWQLDGDGRRRPRSVHRHPHYKPERPFALTEILYDPDTFIPRQFTGYDWPEPGRDGPLELGERYAYDDVDFDVVLTDADFDPANPSYAFTRF